MNNSDYNDFNNWQNGDENEMNNPNNWHHQSGFFFYNPNNPAFKKLWESMNNKDEYIDNMKDYLNMNDMLNEWGKTMRPNKQPQKRQPKISKNKPEIFAQDDYLKLIEIRGYLAITEQYAHVKALDKILQKIMIVPKDPKNG